MKHDSSEEAFRAGRISAIQSDHGLIPQSVSDLAGTADGFHLCTDLIDLVERGRSRIKGTADPARPHVLAVRLSGRAQLEFRVFYVEPQQVVDESNGDDRARPAVIEGGARTHRAPLQPPPEVPQEVAAQVHAPDASGTAPEAGVEPVSSERVAPTESATQQSRADAYAGDDSQSQARDDAVPHLPSPPRTGTEVPTEQPSTLGELFQPKNATVLALRDAKDTRLAHKILRAERAGRLKHYEDFIEQLKKAHNPLRVRELLTATYQQGHITVDRLGSLDWSGLEGITKAVPLRRAMFVRGRIGPIAAPGSLRCRLYVEALLSREHDEVVRSLVHKGNLNCHILDRGVALKIAPLWDRGYVRVKLGVRRGLAPEARFGVTIEDAYLEQCDDEQRNALANELAEQVRRAPPAEPEWTMDEPWPTGDV